MSHYINFIESSEVEPAGPQGRIPFRTSLVGGIVLLILCVMGFKSFGYTTSVKQAKAMERRWAEIEPEVERASALSSENIRLTKSAATLQGWKSSRYAWASLLKGIVDELFRETQDIQMTRVYFDENLEGLRKQIPGQKPTDYFPVKRKVDVFVSGVIKSTHPVGTFTRFKRNLVEQSSIDFPIQTVSLEYFLALKDKNRNPTDSHQFFFEMGLIPREMKP